MKDFKTGFNPFSSENLTMFLTVLIISSTLLVIMILVDKFIIPRLNPENKFVKWWEKHMVSINPFEEN